jgi:hypothetical protein
LLITRPFLLARDLIGKPVPTFPDHALNQLALSKTRPARYCGKAYSIDYQ